MTKDQKQDISLTAAQQLPLPNFPKVKYASWHLDQLMPVQKAISNAHFLTAEDVGIEILGTQAGHQYLPQELINAGVLVMSIQAAKKDYPQLVQRYLSSVIPADQDRLSAQNLLQYNAGIFVYIPDNVVIQSLLQLVLVQNATTTGDAVQRMLIYVGKNAQCTILQQLRTMGEATIKSSTVIEVFLDTGANVHYSAIDALSANTSGYLNRSALLADNAQLNWAQAEFNRGNMVMHLDTMLSGQGAQTHANVMAMVSQKQVQGINTRVSNRGRHTIGHILQRGVILDHAALVFNGVGNIIKGAKGADAQQESRILMLSKKARGDANPLLLIDESDVTAGHAASVGRMNAAQLYYLMSRGLCEKVARRLVIRGFMGPILAQIPHQVVRESIIEDIERQLKDAHQ